MKIHKNTIPTLFTIPALIVLVFLGSWQVHRLNWKNNIVSEVESKIAMEPILMPSKVDDIEDLKYRKIIARGEFLHDEEIHLFTGQKKFKGDSGYDILTPMKLENGGYVLVDRGWVPSDKKEADKRPETLTDGVVTVLAMLHKGEKPGRFTPDNDMEENLWFWIDMDAISKQTGHDFQNLYLRQLKKDGDSDLPVGGDEKIKHRNDHLQYAVTWYALAIILIVIYFLYRRRSN